MRRTVVVACSLLALAGRSDAALTVQKGHSPQGRDDSLDVISITNTGAGSGGGGLDDEAPGRESLAERTPPESSQNLALAALDRRIADLDTEEAAEKHELTIVAAKIAGARAQSVTHGRAFYKLTRAGLLPVGGGFSEFIRHAMNVERGRRALSSHLNEEVTLRARGRDLASALERVARDRTSLAKQRTAMDAARIALADESRRQAAFDRAFESSNSSGDYVAIYGGSSRDIGSGGGFAASRGQLLFPVIGRAEVHPARRDGADGPGLELRAPFGSKVRAVFAGHVAFADRYGSYGRIIILDHGEHYYTVSGNLATIDVHVGDEISAGESIGTVGDEGQGSLLYFEVRHGSETIPPAPWLGM